MKEESLLMKYDRILITGGSGFIGSNLAGKLVAKGYKVRILDNMSKQIHGENYKESQLYKSIENITEIIIGSVCDRESWIKALVDVDVVIHLAAETGTGQSMYEVAKYVDVNVGGTSLMWDILANEKHKVKKVIVASSRAVYGEGKYYCPNHGNVYPNERKDEDMKKGDFNAKCPVCNVSVELLPTDEMSKIHPASVYGLTKYMQEELCMIMGKSLNIPVVAFRYQNVYGPGQSLKNPYTGILSIFSNRIRNGKEINIFEDGKESRDFVFIDDVVDATILGMEKDEANYLSINVGTGVATDVFKVAKTLIDNYGKSVALNVSGNYRIGDIRHNYADLTLAREKLNYEPKVNFEEGIGRFTKWVENQAIEEDRYEMSLEEMQKKGLYK